MAVFKWAIAGGTGPYAYDDPANWTLVSGSSAAGYPVSGDTATIIGSTTAFETITGPGAAGTLDFGGTTMLHGSFITGIAEIGGTFDAGISKLVLRTGSTLETPGPAMPGTASLSIGAEAGARGSVDVNGGLVDLGNNGLVVGGAGTGVMTVENGGSVVATGIAIDFAGGHGTLVVSGATVTDSGTLSIGNTRGTGSGTLEIENGGVVQANSAAIDSGGEILLDSGTLATSLSIRYGAFLHSDGDSEITGAGIVLGGVLEAVSGTLVVDGTVRGDPSTELYPLIAINENAEAVFRSGADQSVILSLLANSGRIEIDDPGEFHARIENFQVGNTIFAQGAASISYRSIDHNQFSPVTLYGTDGAAIGSLSIDGGNVSGFVDHDGTITGIPCFVTGTLIDTAEAPIAVEDLRIGDRVLTASGDVCAVKWIGRRAYDGRFIAGRGDALPVRIRAGAIDENVPRRDLLVSPHHAMMVDGVLIAAEHLINGVSVVQEQSVEHVEYFHIELDTHDILLAEGAPAESFVDCDSRAMFQNAAEFAALYPQTDAPRWEFCAERVEGGVVLERVRARLAARAGIVATEGGALRGAIDEVSRHEIVGWAAGESTEPVALVVCVDGVAVARVLANRYRRDLAASGVFQGRHGFRVGLALDPRTPHVVTLRRAGGGAALPGSPVLLPARPARPALDGVPVGALLDAAAAIGAHPRGVSRVRSVRAALPPAV